MTGPGEATFYVQIQKRKQCWRNGRWSYVSAVRMTTEPPAQLLPGAVAVKLTVRLPMEAFDPIAPSAVIDIPADLIQRPVQVEASDP